MKYFDAWAISGYPQNRDSITLKREDIPAIISDRCIEKRFHHPGEVSELGCFTALLNRSNEWGLRTLYVQVMTDDVDFLRSLI